ncbi:histidine kinase [Actinoplanes italicus]|uniref:Two-component system sensor histidine kinase DesK n=1 Tax=Actinoplanes italicus TaxID=113567 RepID=A0A2T0KA36_9ACTN|nr:histidine kinase [Actinoplanes italicus]PRX19980.1 two-component system sensor histidine kinase DesK [Actinoplanes italicus]GIE31833.1 histidine kinase [Actinoplanes italicus]
MSGGIKRARMITIWSLSSSLVLAWFGAAAGTGLAIADDRVQPVRLAVTAVAILIFSWYGIRLTRSVATDWPRHAARTRTDMIVTGVAAVVVMLVQDAGPAGWGMVAVGWVCLVTVRAGQLQTLGLALGTAAVCVAVSEINPGPQPLPFTANILIYSIMCLALAYPNKLWIWILDLTEQAHATKDAEARLAVTEERLRFARDLHDLVGHSLSVIAVKSELAGKLTAIDTERAAAQMAEVRGLAQDSLRQIREAVRGYRILDLASEIASVQSILEADGVRCKIDLPPDAVAPEAAGPFAWVVRESATNILRHSTATWCTVTLRSADGSAVLEVVNDGVGAATEPGGTGLAGLAERLTAVGGSLTAQPTGDGRFLVRAVAPSSPSFSPASPVSPTLPASLASPASAASASSPGNAA